MTILCATDFSTVATRAVHVAARWAKRLERDLTIVNVVLPPPALPHEMGEGAGLFRDTLEESAQEALDKVAKELSSYEIKVDTLVRFGSPVDCLISLVEEKNIEMLVLGTHGRSGAARFFLGSVAERSVQKAPCPVLIVPEDALEGLSAAEHSVSDAPLRILAGLDASRGGRAATEWLRKFSSKFDSEIQFLHLYWPPHEHARLGVEGPFDPLDDCPEIENIIRREYQPLIDGFSKKAKIDLRVIANWGANPDPFALEASTDDADLIVMGMNKKHGAWGGSTTLATVRAATMPVLCVPGRLHDDQIDTKKKPIPALRQVLVTTDYSETGNRAIVNAMQLVHAMGGVVNLLHVAPASKAGLTLEAHTKEKERLRALIPSDAKLRGIRVKCDVVESDDVHEAILQASERLAVDMIVLGSHGRSGISRSVLGSVADYVVRNAVKPVVIVGPNTTATEPAQ